MEKLRGNKCRNCQKSFIPDHRNRNKQRYCSKPKCKKASKATSQKKWLEKAENKKYFSGPDNVRRVQEWRKNNPGYWKKRKASQKPLQDCLNENDQQKQYDRSKLANKALQDLLACHHAILVDLLSKLIGSRLQEDIVCSSLLLQQLGRNIITELLAESGSNYDSK